MESVKRRPADMDFRRFDKSQQKRIQRVNSAKTDRTIKAITPFAAISYVVAVVLLFLIVFSYVSLTVTASEGMKLKKELSSLKEEVQMLEITKTKSISSDEIFEQAVMRFGMKKIDKSQITYVNVQKEDKISVSADPEGSNLLAGLGRGLGSILEYIN